jgi:hypothetical protein
MNSIPIRCEFHLCSRADARSSLRPAPKVLAEKLFREPFAVFGANDRFGLRLWIDNPSSFMKQIYQIPIQSLPDATVIVERERQNRERGFRQLVGVDFARQSI